MCNGNTTPLSSPRGARAWDVLPSFVSCIHLISFPSHRKHHEAFLFQIHEAGEDLCAGIGWRSCCCGWGWERSIQEPSRSHPGSPGIPSTARWALGCLCIPTPALSLIQAGLTQPHGAIRAPECQSQDVGLENPNQCGNTNSQPQRRDG